MQLKINKIWAKTHSDVLKYVINIIKIDREEFASELLVSDATVRQWLTGRGFPDTKNLSALYKNIENRTNRNRDSVLNNEIKDFLVNAFRSLDNEQLEYSSNNDNVGKLLVAKLSSCYARGKQVQQSSPTETRNFESTGFTKAIVFDFDGTLTESSSARTTWEAIWVALGYDIQECRDLHTRFDKKRNYAS